MCKRVAQLLAARVGDREDRGAVWRCPGGRTCSTPGRCPFFVSRPVGVTTNSPVHHTQPLVVLKTRLAAPACSPPMHRPGKWSRRRCCAGQDPPPAAEPPCAPCDVRSSRCWWRARSLLPSATASSPPPHSQGRAAQGRVSKPHSETPSALSCLSDLPRDVCSLGLVATEARPSVGKAVRHVAFSCSLRPATPRL